MKHFRLLVITLSLTLLAVASGFYFGLEELVKLNDKFKHFRESVVVLASGETAAEKKRLRVKSAESLPDTQNFNSVYFQFTGNFDFKTQMHYIGNHVWQVAVRVPQENELFIFVADDGQQIIYGDEDTDGIAEQDGSDIPIGVSGLYIVQFDERDMSYDVAWRGEDVLVKVAQSRQEQAQKISGKRRAIGSAPVARAGADIVIDIGETAFFDGSASTDPDDDIAQYTWSNGLSGELVTKQYELAGEYPVLLTVTDEEGNTASDELNVVVRARINGLRVNHEWVMLRVHSVTGETSEVQLAVAGDHLWTGTISMSELFQGYIMTGNSTPQQLGDNDQDGVADVNGQPIAVQFGGDYVVQFDDSNNRYSIFSAGNNLMPVANAGIDQTVQPSEIVMIDASASTDPDGYIASYQWDVGGSSEILETSFDQPGEYEVRLTVTDDAGASSSDSVVIHVLDQYLQSSVKAVSLSAAGHHQNMALRLSGDNLWQAELRAQASSYRFIEVDSEGQSIQLGDNEADGFADISGRLIAVETGKQYRVSYSDDTKAYQWQVSTQSNEPPVAMVNEDITTLPGKNITLNASASYDSDGFIARYLWSDGQEGSILNFSIAEPGMYEYIVTVYDDQGAEATAGLRVFVEDVDAEFSMPMYIMARSGQWRVEAMSQNGSQWEWSAALSENDEIFFVSNSPNGDKWGDTNGDGVADKFGPAIPVATSGYYRVVIDPESRVYRFRADTTMALAPIADAGADQTVIAGDWVQFSGSASQAANGGTLVRYSWSFGEDGPSVSRQYDAPGHYTETLTVFDDTGNSAEDSVHINVTASTAYGRVYEKVEAVVSDSRRSKQAILPLNLVGANEWQAEIQLSESAGMQFEIKTEALGQRAFFGAAQTPYGLQENGPPISANRPGVYLLTVIDIAGTYSLQWLRDVVEKQYQQLTVDILAPGADKQAMELVDRNTWRANIISDASWTSPALVVLANGTLKLGDVNADGVLDRSDVPIPLEAGGKWLLEVNDATSEYILMRTSYERTFAQLYLTYAGLQLPMELINDHTWSVMADFGVENDQFMFDVFGNNSLVYGDNDGDRVADDGGEAIHVHEPGSYEIRFYDNTQRYIIFERPD